MNVFSTLATATLSLLLTPILMQSQQGSPASSTTPARTNLQVTQCALKVNGMVCGGCTTMVKQGLLKLQGVTAASVDYKTGRVQVTYDRKKTGPEKILAEFNQKSSGFHAELAQPENKHSP